MHNIIDNTGWPRVSSIGQQAAHALWTIVQHADHDPDFQAKCLEEMKALPRNEIILNNLAYLEDRVRTNHGRPQLFGTQYYLHGDHFGPRPIEDEHRLEDRRTAHGLGPIEEYDALMQEMHANRQAKQ